jgi:hypothetical protein
MRATITMLPGFPCVVVAAAAGQIMCALLGRGVLLNPEVFFLMLVFSCASFGIFCGARKIASPPIRAAAGIGGSYLAFLAVIFVFAVLRDEVAEAVLRLPAMLVYGIPLMAPLVGMAWLGSTLWRG